MTNPDHYMFAHELQQSMELRDQGREVLTLEETSQATANPVAAEAVSQAQRVADARQDVMKALESVDA